jgi:hypothetical protein
MKSSAAVRLSFPSSDDHWIVRSTGASEPTTPVGTSMRTETTGYVNNGETENRFPYLRLTADDDEDEQTLQ